MKEYFIYFHGVCVMDGNSKKEVRKQFLENIQTPVENAYDYDYTIIVINGEEEDEEDW